MSYTRYDYRKKGKKTIAVYLAVIIFSVFIGSGIFKLLLLNKNWVIKNNETGNNISSNIKENRSFGIIQCGLFSSEENARKALDNIPEGFQKVLVKNQDKYKVIAGIYSQESINEKTSLLSNQQIENFKVNCILNNKDSNEKVIAGIVEAYLKIIDTVNEKDVEGYNTAKFKEWVSNVSSNCKQEENLNKLIKNINSLPEEYKKENISSSINFLYDFLENYKK